MGLNWHQFERLILRPTLADAQSVIPSSEVAVKLVGETIWHESGGLTYLAQVPHDGPALGLCQMEGPTFGWLMKKILNNSNLTPELTRYGIAFKDLLDPRFAVIMCRYRYWVVPEALPEGSLRARANYWGQYYQTTQNQDKIAQYILAAGRIPWLS